MSLLKQLSSNVYQWSEFSNEKKINFNGYYVSCLSESVIIDPPFLSDDGINELKNIIKNKPNNSLKAIMLTNVNHDRMCLKFKEIFNVPVYIHEGDARALNFQADHTFCSDDVEFFGFEVIHLSNQKSPGECAFYLKDEKKMFIGDALIGRVPGELNLLPPEMFSDINLAIKSLNVLSGYDFDDLLLGDGESIIGNGKKALENFLFNYSNT
jgi:glyoxylase-like metal-dependent hydrolase (beta-lactamase superfamily II)